MTAADQPDEGEILLNAYVDGELDAVAARDFEMRLAADPKLRAALAALGGLRTELRAGRAQDMPSSALRARLAGQPTRRRQTSWPWVAMAASLVLGVAIGAGITFGALRPAAPGSTLTVADEIVADHIRALMAPQPFDIASSDKHTVKPWFDGKLAFAPDVIDLAADGYPLVGGRIDVIGLQPLPVIVYGAGKHLISLVEMPSSAAASAGLQRSSNHGFEVLGWNNGTVAFWAVSDASDDALQAFVKALRSADGA